MAFLNNAGVKRLWAHITTKLNKKVDKQELFETGYTDTLTWDGVVGDRYTTILYGEPDVNGDTMYTKFVRLCDPIPVDGLNGTSATITMVFGGETVPITQVLVVEEDLGCYVLIADDLPISCVAPVEVHENGLAFHPGTYFMVSGIKLADGTEHDQFTCVSLTLANQVFPTQTIKPELLPEIENGVQSDWNQNDESAADYIKNRICYDLNGVLVDDTQAVQELEGIAAYMFSCPQLAVEEKYKLQINNDVYEEVEAKVDTMFGMGAYMGAFVIFIKIIYGIETREEAAALALQYLGVEDSGENYLIMPAEEDTILVILETPTDECYLKLEGRALKQVDYKYIPVLPYVPEEELESRIDGLDKYLTKSSPVATGSFSIDRKADTTVGYNSTAIGYNTEASGSNSIALGSNSVATGNESISIGKGTASGENSRTLGYNTEASGYSACAIGLATKATNKASTAFGWSTEANGEASTAFGRTTFANGNYSHVLGYKLWADSDYQLVHGKVNIHDRENKYAHIVGNGTDVDTFKASNAYTLDWEGNGWFAGTIKVGGTGQDDVGAVELSKVGHAHTYSEVGAAASNHTHDTYLSLEVANFAIPYEEGKKYDCLIAYGNGKYWVVPQDFYKPAYSTDAKTWNVSSVDSISNDYYNSIAYGNGKFVIVPTQHYGGQVFYYNGSYWSDTTIPLTEEEEDSELFCNWTSVVYGNNKFVAVGRDYNESNYGCIAYSSNGGSWTRLEGSVVEGNKWNSIAYGNGKFVAIGSELSSSVHTAYSTDGINWTSGTSLSGLSSSDIIMYGGDKFIILGSNYIFYSSDGVTWTKNSLPVSANRWFSSAYGNGIFVAVSYYGQSMYSNNGINWTQMSMPSGNWHSITYGDGKFVAVGISNNMVCTAHSTDGVNWTTGEAKITQNGIDVTETIKALFA